MTPSMMFVSAHVLLYNLRWVGGLPRQCTRPADVLVPNWDLGKPAAFALSVTSAQISQEAVMTAGWAERSESIASIRENKLIFYLCLNVIKGAGNWAGFVSLLWWDVGTEAIQTLSRLVTSLAVSSQTLVFQWTVWKTKFPPCEQGKLSCHSVLLACYLCR